MNREVKFRIYLEKEKKIIYPDDNLRLVGRDGAVYNWLEQSFEKHRNEDYGGDFRCVIQQFIGLKDINNIDIYEGDLVNFTIRGFNHGPETEYIKKSTVIWDEELLCWSFGEPGYSICGDNIDVKSFEVVGNIFQEEKIKKGVIKF